MAVSFDSLIIKGWDILNKSSTSLPFRGYSTVHAFFIIMQSSSFIIMIVCLDHNNAKIKQRHSPNINQ